MPEKYTVVDIKEKLHYHLINKTDLLKKKDTLSEDDLRKFVAKSLDDLCEELEVDVFQNDRLTIVREIVGGMISLGPIRPLIEDKSISEIMINGYDKIYIQKNGRIELTDVKFEDNKHLTHTIQKILAASGSNRRVDESSPYVDFSLSDGSRVNVIVPPVSLVGPVVTIRKFASDISTIDDLIKRNMMSKKMAAFLIAAIRAKLNIVFSGATGTGKTTILNVLSRHIPHEERIITIEDTSELRLLQDHVVSLQTKVANIEGKGAITIREMFINSLRMRPDRIIIGEVRGDEALDMIQSITSGHAGSLAIVHGESPTDCFNRIVTMILMSGIRLSVEEIKKQVANALDLIVHTELFLDGCRRITYVTDVEYRAGTGENVFLEDIFYFDQEKVLDNGSVVGKWVMKKKKPSFYKKFIKRNVGLPDNFFETDD